MAAVAGVVQCEADAMKFVSRLAIYHCHAGSSPVRHASTSKYEWLPVPFWVAAVSLGNSQPQHS